MKLLLKELKNYLSKACCHPYNSIFPLVNYVCNKHHHLSKIPNFFQVISIKSVISMVPYMEMAIIVYNKWKIILERVWIIFKIYLCLLNMFFIVSNLFHAIIFRYKTYSIYTLAMNLTILSNSILLRKTSKRVITL